MTIKERIIAEIKRYRKVIEDPILSGNDLIIGERNAYFNMLRFIESLPDESECDDLDEAAKCYSKSYYEATHRDASYLDDAFKAGAEWQRNSVWHDSDKEQPEGNRTVVVWNPAIKDGEILTFCVEVFEHRLWAYIEDILPTEILKFSNS